MCSVGLNVGSTLSDHKEQATNPLAHVGNSASFEHGGVAVVDYETERSANPKASVRV